MDSEIIKNNNENIFLHKSLKYSILLFVCFLSFSMAFSNFFLYFSFLLSSIIWYKEKRLPQTHGLFLPYLLLMTWISISSFWSPIPINYLKSLKIGHYLIFLVLIDLKFDYKFLKNSLIIFLSINSIIMFLAIFSSNLNQKFPYADRLSEWAIRYKGCFTNPIAYGGFLSMILLVSLIYIIFIEKNEIHRGFFYGTLVILSLGIILTGSRGVWLGLLISLSIFFYYIFNKKEKLIFGILLLLIPIIISISPLKKMNITTYVTNRINASLHGDTNGRSIIYKTGISMIKENPIFGGGAGFVEINFLKFKKGLNIPNNVENSHLRVMESGTHLHNNFLQFWAEGGIIEIILFLGLIYIFLKKIKLGFTLKEVKNPFFFAILLILTSHLISGMFEYNFFYSNVSRLFWFFLGILFKLGFDFEKKQLINEKQPF